MALSDIDFDTLECAIHHRIEPHQDGSIWCPECWHTFWDEEELVATEMREWGFLTANSERTPTVEEIGSCPLCLHDW